MKKTLLVLCVCLLAGGLAFSGGQAEKAMMQGTDRSTKCPE